MVNKWDTMEELSPSPHKLRKTVKETIFGLENQIHHLVKEDVHFISSKKSIGFRPLVKSLQKESRHRKTRGLQRNLFIIGNINSGKSTFIQSLHNFLKKYNKKFIHDPFDKIMRKNLEEVKKSKHLDVHQKLALTCSLVPQSTLAIRRVKIPQLGHLLMYYLLCILLRFYSTGK